MAENKLREIEEIIQSEFEKETGELNLPDFGIGELPVEIGLLKHLEKINLAGNNQGRFQHLSAGSVICRN